MTAAGLAAAIDRLLEVPEKGARLGRRLASIRERVSWERVGGPGWSPATSGCSGAAVTREARRKALCVAVLVESLVVPEWVEWTVARIDATGRVRAHGGGAAPGVPSPRTASGLAAGRAPPGLPALRVARQEGVRSGSCHARRRAVTDLLWPDDVRGIGPPDVVVSFLPADRTAWDGPTPRHGVWAIAPMDDGRPASAPEPLLGGARTQPAPPTRRSSPSGTACTRVIAEDVGACRSALADAHARRRRMDLCTPRPALPAAAPAGRRPRPGWRRSRGTAEPCPHRR